MITELKKVQENPEFLKWHKDHDKAYLSSIFLLKEKSDFKVAYYNPENNKITTFEAEPFKILPEDDVMGDNNVKALNMDEVKVSFTKAIQEADKLRKEKVGNEGVQQSIFILQNLNAQLYNITFVTTAFNILNIKIDANSGEVIKTDLSNLIGSTKIL